MSGNDVLPCVERGPEGASAAVIWLHGLGADGHDFEPIIPMLEMPDGLDVRFVFPHAPPRPVTLNGGMVMRAWYDIRALGLDERDHDERGIVDSEKHVRALIERETARGVEVSRIVLAGFSQGAAMALHVGLRHPERLAGMVALSAYLLYPERLEADAAEANRQTPILLAHGTMDPVVPLQAGEHARDRLTALGHPVRFSTYPVPHSVHPDEISAVGAFLAERLGA